MTFSKAVKSIHKLVSAPKKSISKFHGLSNIFTFLSSLLAACFVIILSSKRTKCILRQPIKFQNARPCIPFDTPATGASLALLLAGSHPPTKTPAYRPVYDPATRLAQKQGRIIIYSFGKVLSATLPR